MDLQKLLFPQETNNSLYCQEQNEIMAQDTEEMRLRDRLRASEPRGHTAACAIPLLHAASKQDLGLSCGWRFRVKNHPPSPVKRW